MSEKSLNANTAKKKPRGKPFTGADDPRGNKNGQRSKEVVQTVAQARALYVQVLAEAPNLEVEPKTKLESIVRAHVSMAQGLDAIANGAREAMFDRLWGKAAQPVTGPDGAAIQVQAVDYRAAALAVGTEE